MDYLLLFWPTQEECMEGIHLLLFSFMGGRIQCISEEGPDLSNTSACTCHRGNAGLALRENKLSVPFWPLKPTSKSESFWEPWVSAESGPLTTLSWLHASMKPQRGENGNPWYGEQNKEKHLKKLRGHSQMHLL
jgi:hypothetical protein